MNQVHPVKVYTAINYQDLGNFKKVPCYISPVFVVVAVFNLESGSLFCWKIIGHMKRSLLTTCAHKVCHHWKWMGDKIGGYSYSLIQLTDCDVKKKCTCGKMEGVI